MAAKKKREKYLVESDIAIKKQMLAQTDYKALKYAEGEISEEEYLDTRNQRSLWRNEINELEAELATYPPEDEETR